jgi:hypothetical protein
LATLTGLTLLVRDIEARLASPRTLLGARRYSGIGAAAS